MSEVDQVTVVCKPFHESIVEQLRFASDEGLQILGELIIETVIPKNHDAIIAAWEARCKAMCWADDEIRGVVESILRQKTAQQSESEKGTIFALVFLDSPAELCQSDGSQGLFARKETAEQFCGQWNGDVGACETRPTTVIPLEVYKSKPVANTE